ncbi:MAG: LTA synthase family protein [Acidobacteria bacterium]|nr:LTA synthase family protein [Acidobacteriota bacterium]
MRDTRAPGDDSTARPRSAAPLSGPAAAIKIAAILSFVFLTNPHAAVGERVDELIRNFDGYLGVGVFGGLWAVCLAGMLTTSFVSTLWLRFVLALPLLAGALVGSAYEDAARVEIDYDHALMLREGIAHAGPALRLYAGSVFGAGLLALLGAAGILLPMRSFGRFSVSGTAPRSDVLRRVLGSRRLRNVLPAAAAAMPIVLLAMVILARGGYGMAGLPVQHKLPALLMVIEMHRWLRGDAERGPLVLRPDAEAPPAPHVVLVVDRGVRGDYLDLNRVRGTTPALLGGRDRIANFGYAVAAANCSTASNLILRTGARPADLPQGVHTNPYIWSYARRAGMRTVFIPGSERPLAHGMSFRERRQVDEVVRTQGGTRRARDLHAVELIRNRLLRSEPQLIIAVKSGISREASSRATRLDDPYGKAVASNLDPFFGRLLADVPLDDVVVLYTSDHGQDLLDDGSWINCSTSGASPLEALVPMLAITRHPAWRGRFAAAAARNRNRTSHYNLFATLLALFGYDPAHVAERYEPGLLDATEAEYGFTTGLVSASPRMVIGSRGRLPVQRIPPAAFEDGGM